MYYVWDSTVLNKRHYTTNSSFRSCVKGCRSDRPSVVARAVRSSKVFDVQWAFSSFVSVRAVLHDYPALFQHFSDNADSESNRTSKEKSKYRGLAKKLQSWFLLSETCSLKDGLRSIKQLSLYLQSNNATVMRAMDHIEILKDRLLALKEGSGQTLKKFWASYDIDGSYKGVKVIKN